MPIWTSQYHDHDREFESILIKFSSKFMGFKMDLQKMGFINSIPEHLFSEVYTNGSLWKQLCV